MAFTPTEVMPRRNCEQSGSSVSRELLPFRGHGASMGPIRLTDEQLSAVLAAARPLAPADRDSFLQAVAEALRDRPVGDGTVYRIIAGVQHRFFDPPLETRYEAPPPPADSGRKGGPRANLVGTAAAPPSP